jgi:hypothetical protein
MALKSEKAIRSHRDNLRLCRQNHRCRCKGRQHQMQCFIGGKMLMAVEDMLTWVLDENSTGFQDQIIEYFAQRAADVR